MGEAEEEALEPHRRDFAVRLRRLPAAAGARGGGVLEARRADAGARAQYKEMLDRILSALDFMRVCGAGDDLPWAALDALVSEAWLAAAAPPVE